MTPDELTSETTKAQTPWRTFTQHPGHRPGQRSRQTRHPTRTATSTVWNRPDKDRLRHFLPPAAEVGGDTGPAAAASPTSTVGLGYYRRQWDHAVAVCGDYYGPYRGVARNISVAETKRRTEPPGELSYSPS